VEEEREFRDGEVRWQRSSYSSVEILPRQNEALRSEVERLQRNLDGRDTFIVGKGLWLEFVDQLPPVATQGRDELVESLNRIYDIGQQTGWDMPSVKIAAAQLQECRSEVEELKETEKFLHDEIVATAETWRTEVARLRSEVERLTEENFALAADQCHDGYAGEHGHHCCREQDTLRTQLAACREALEEVMAEFGYTLPLPIKEKITTAINAGKGE